MPSAVWVKLLIACVTPAWASSAESCAEKRVQVRVTLVTILAGEERDEVEAKLRHVADEVRKLNPQLRSFRLHAMADRTVSEGESATFALPEGKKATVSLRQGPDGEGRVSLTIAPPEQGEIALRTVTGKFLPIVTRHQTKARERVILAVRVEPVGER